MNATAVQPDPAAALNRPTSAPRGAVAPKPSIIKARAPIGRLTLANLGGALLGAAVGLGLAWLMGGGDEQTLALPGLASLAATALGVVVIALLGARDAFTWAPLQIAVSTGRLALGLFLTVAMYLAVQDGRLGAGPETVLPSKVAFFGVFLASAAATMVAEVAVFRSFLTSIAAHRPGAVTNAATETEPGE